MREPNASPRPPTLRRCLPALGVDPATVLAWDVLSGGVSGAGAYRLRTASGDMVLKITTPETSGEGLDRARREMLFYQRLAPQVPVRIPAVIASHCDPATGACLLMQAYRPPPAPSNWTDAMYARAAEQLGRLHAAYWGASPDVLGGGWPRRGATAEAADVQRARGAWERLGAEPRFERVLTREHLASVLGMLARIDETISEPPPLPVTLCHGDFHIGNLLVDRDGEIVIADWQEVGLGLGPEDLSFFIQRASFSGGTVPVDVMVDAYRRSLASGVATDVPRTEITRVMDAAELRTRLVHWPYFLASASEGQLAEHLDRMRVLWARR